MARSSCSSRDGSRLGSRRQARGALHHWRPRRRGQQRVAQALHSHHVSPAEVLMSSCNGSMPASRVWVRLEGEGLWFRNEGFRLARERARGGMWLAHRLGGTRQALRLSLAPAVSVSMCASRRRAAMGSAAATPWSARAEARPRSWSSPKTSSRHCAAQAWQQPISLQSCNGRPAWGVAAHEASALTDRQAHTDVRVRTPDSSPPLHPGPAPSLPFPPPTRPALRPGPCGKHHRCHHNPGGSKHPLHLLSHFPSSCWSHAWDLPFTNRTVLQVSISTPGCFYSR